MENELKKIISEITKIPVEKLDSSKNIFIEYGIESIVGIQVLAAVGNKYNVEIPDHEAAKIMTLSDLATVIKKHRQ